MPAPDKQTKLQPVPGLSAEAGAFREPIQDELERVQQRICELLRSEDPQIDPVLQSLAEHTGKMLRPALVLLSGACVGAIGADHIDLAAMVELVHRASLLHDDVIDAAETRRSHPTANVLWGNSAAVLLGDLLLSKAFSLGLSVQVPNAAGILAEAADRLCSGELMQNFQKARWEMSEQQYNRIIEAKTAVLFESSCRLGAVASGASSEQVEALSRFGLQLGAAFQVADDLIDLLSTDQQAGKTLGTDLAQGKLTLPLIHWLSAAPACQSDRIELLESLNIEAILQQLHQSGSIDYAFRRLDERIADAKDTLSGLPDSPAQNALKSLADYITQRLKRPPGRF